MIDVDSQATTFALYLSSRGLFAYPLVRLSAYSRALYLYLIGAPLSSTQMVAGMILAVVLSRLSFSERVSCHFYLASIWIVLGCGS